MVKYSSKDKYGTIRGWKLSEKERRQKRGLLSKKVRPIDMKKSVTVADMVEAMSGMSIQARNIGRAAEVLKNIYRDKKRPTVFLGLAGPLIAAGLRGVIKDLIVTGAVDVVVSTGAIIYQDVYQAKGHAHYVGSPRADDVLLNKLKIDRIYDTYTDEEMFWKEDHFCGRVADEMSPGIYSSREYLEHLADRLTDKESILYQCRKYNVPVFCPALNDSSIGIGLTEHHMRCHREGKPGIAIDSIKDNYEIVQVVAKSPKTAAIYVAGGVPKNYINDSIVMGYLFGVERGHDYAIQVTTAVTSDGGLSGSTLSEARSWGKVKHAANYAMAWVEPSVSLPLLAGYIFGRDLCGRRRRLDFKWKGRTLQKIGVK